MITNYYTLVHIIAELEHGFAGQTVSEIFTQHRGELVISFKEIPAVIIAGCEPANNFIYARKTFARARRNSADLFTDIQDTVIEKVFIHPTDRQLHICLKDKRKLIVQLFGSKANVLLLNAQGIIVETFLKKSDAKVTRIESKQTESAAVTSGTFLSTYAEQPLATALKRVLPQFGPVLVKELLVRVELNGEQTVNTFLENEIVRLLDSAKRMKEELLAPPSPRVYFDGTSPVRFSIIPLHHLGDFTFQNYSSVSEAIQTYRANLHHEKTVLQEKEDIVRVLEREREHTERTLRKIAEEVEKSNRAEQYELFGKLLISQLHLLKRGDTRAVVEDFVSGSNACVEIPLDQHLTPAKNAERYFEKAEKSRHALEEQQHRIAELTQRRKSVSLLLDRMDEVSTENDLKQFEEENRSALSQFGLKAEKSGQVKKEEQLPFRVFTVAGGFQVWAGKSGENNDLLSTRHTAKNDLWFHARGVGGSHVVLKIGTGKGEVSKQAIEQAAGVAAYYSKMKKSKLVPVTMCEGKYVRKPKGVPAGTVTVEREKTIFAEPGLPPLQ
ncbi:MAG: NFACT family protein [Bacteroidota bacterium]|jgi:predicted ribosome quality control (RQC) complex YloA/Tae2 family protein